MSALCKRGRQNSVKKFEASEIRNEVCMIDDTKEMRFTLVSTLSVELTVMSFERGQFRIQKR